MKRIFILTVFLFIGINANAQVIISILLGDKLNSGKVEFGLDGGFNLSDIQGLDDAGSASRFNIGFYFDIKLKNPSWMVHTGVIVKSTVGAKDLPVYSLDNPELDGALAGGSVDRKLSYFNVPVLMKYLFKNNFSLEAGPMLGLMNQANDIFTKEVKDKDDLTYKIKIKDHYHPLDAGLMAGIGYRLMGGNGMNLGIRYYFGLVDITIDDSDANQYNRSLYFSVGIPVGKGKKKSKE
jgi:Outer membrane protein beta-barrel domain